jgi:hypothetical protein
MDRRRVLQQGIEAGFQNTAFTAVYRAMLGRGDGSGVITNPDGLFPCEVWLHEEGKPPELGVLSDLCSLTYDDLPNYDGTEVLVGFMPNDRLPYVICVTNSGQRKFGNRKPMEQLALAAYYPTVDRLQDLRVSPTPTPSTSVRVQGCTYTQPSTGDIKVFNETTFPLATLIDALGTDEQQVAWICLDYETGALFAPAIAATTTSGVLPTRGEFSPDDIGGIAITSTYKRSVPVYLYENQTEIVEADFYRNLDARLDYPLHTQNSGERLYYFHTLI